MKGARESSFIILAENVQWLSRTQGEHESSVIPSFSFSLIHVIVLGQPIPMVRQASL